MQPLAVSAGNLPNRCQPRCTACYPSPAVRVVITDYARKRMALRKITRHEVEKAIYHPVGPPRPSEHGKGRVVFTGAQGSRTIEVVVEPGSGEWVVVTVWD